MRHVQPLCTWLRARAVALLLKIQPAVQGKLIEQAAKGGKERAGRCGGVLMVQPIPSWRKGLLAVNHRGTGLSHSQAEQCLG